MFVKYHQGKNRAHTSRRLSDEKCRSLTQPVAGAWFQRNQNICACLTRGCGIRSNSNYLPNVVTSLFHRIANYKSMSGMKTHGPNGVIWRSGRKSINTKKKKKGKTDNNEKENFAHRKAFREKRFYEKHILN